MSSGRDRTNLPTRSTAASRTAVLWSRNEWCTPSCISVRASTPGSDSTICVRHFMALVRTATAGSVNTCTDEHVAVTSPLRRWCSIRRDQRPKRGSFPSTSIHWWIVTVVHTGPIRWKLGQGRYLEDVLQERIETFGEGSLGSEEARDELGALAVQRRRQHLGSRAGRHLGERADPRQQKLLPLLRQQRRLVAGVGGAGVGVAGRFRRVRFILVLRRRRRRRIRRRRFVAGCASATLGLGRLLLRRRLLLRLLFVFAGRRRCRKKYNPQVSRIGQNMSHLFLIRPSKIQYRY